MTSAITTTTATATASSIVPCGSAPVNGIEAAAAPQQRLDGFPPPAAVVHFGDEALHARPVLVRREPPQRRQLRALHVHLQQRHATYWWW